MAYLYSTSFSEVLLQATKDTGHPCFLPVEVLEQIGMLLIPPPPPLPDINNLCLCGKIGRPCQPDDGKPFVCKYMQILCRFNYDYFQHPIRHPIQHPIKNMKFPPLFHRLEQALHKAGCCVDASMECQALVPVYFWATYIKESLYRHGYRQHYEVINYYDDATLYLDTPDWRTRLSQSDRDEVTAYLTWWSKYFGTVFKQKYSVHEYIEQHCNIESLNRISSMILEWLSE